MLRKAKKKWVSIIILSAIFTMFASVFNSNKAQALSGGFDSVENDLDLPPDTMKNFITTLPASEFPVYGSFKGQPLVHDVFTANGHAAWCLNYKLPTPNKDSVSVETQPLTDAEFHILLNGYPMVSNKDLGVANDAEANAATQFAMWCANSEYNNGFTIQGINEFDDRNSVGNIVGLKTTQEERSRVKAAAQRIYDAAKKDTRSQTPPKITITQAGSPHVDRDGTTTFTYNTEISNGFKAVNAVLLSSDLPAGTKISQNGQDIDLSGSKATFKVGQPLKVVVPPSSKPQSFTINFTSNTNGYLTGRAYVIGGGVQNVVVQSNTKPDLYSIKGATVSRAAPTLGKISVHKVGEGNEPLANIGFDLIDQDGKVVQSGKTDSNGNLDFLNVPVGSYRIREKNTDNYHELDITDHHVDLTEAEIAASDYPKVTLKNTEKKDAPEIRTFLTETDTDSTKGSRQADASLTNLTDEILITNLSDGHSYRLVETLYDRATNTELKLANGDIAKASVDFDSLQPDPNNGAKRGYSKQTLQFKDVDLRGLQDHKIVAKTSIYRVANKNVPTHDGELLAEEDTMNDENQTISVVKPEIKTVATANAKKTSDSSNTPPQGSKVVNPSSKTHINEWAYLKNLVKGHKYHLQLKEMTTDDSGNPVEYIDPSNNKKVSVDKTITASSEEMVVSTDFPEFSTVGKNGQKLTVYYEISDESGNKLATAKDMSDADETITVTNPKIQTMALIDGDKATNPTQSAMLSDQVKVEGAAPNMPIELSAIAADSHSNAILIHKNSKKYLLMGKIGYTPSSADSIVTVPLMMSNAPTDVKSVSDASVRQKLNQLKAQSYEYIKSDPVKAGAAAGMSDISNPYKIDVTSLAGQEIVLFEDLDCFDNVVTSHADSNDKDQTVRITKPKIQTEALLNDKHISNPSSKSFLIDKESYSDVAPNHPLITSVLAVDKETGKIVEIKEDSKTYNLMGKLMFVPKTAEGTVEVPLQKVDSSNFDVSNANQRIKANNINTVDPRQNNSNIDLHDKKYQISTLTLRNNNLNLFEDLITEDNSILTSEADVNNKDQTVRITNPKISTMQLINNKKNYVLDGSGKNVKVPIIDTVKYEDCAPNETLSTVAVEMDTNTKRPVNISGQYLFGRTTFTPEKAKGQLNVNFNLLDHEPMFKYFNKVLDDSGLLSKDVPKEDLGEGNTTDTRHDVEKQDTSAYDIPMEDIAKLQSLSDGDRLLWTAYESLENSSEDLISEHKDLKDTDQTITLTHHKKDKNCNTCSGVNINNSNNNTSTGGNANSTSKGKGGDSNAKGTSDADSKSKSKSKGKGKDGNQDSKSDSNSSDDSKSRNPGSNGNGNENLGSGAGTGFAQTGGNSKFSSNWVYNLIYKWLLNN